MLRHIGKENQVKVKGKHRNTFHPQYATIQIYNHCMLASYAVTRRGALLNTIIRGETSISANQLAMTFTTSRPYTSLTKRAS